MNPAWWRSSDRWLYPLEINPQRKLPVLLGVLYDVCYMDNVVVAVGARGIFLTSKDGGASWNEVKSGTRRNFYSVTALPGGIFVAVGQGGAIFRSKNHGESWSEVASGTNTQLHSITSTSNKTLIAVGVDGVILRSIDDGESWSTVDSGTHKWLMSITSVSQMTLVAVGSDGIMLRSTDNGENWSAITLENISLHSVANTQNGTLIAVGTGRYILRSTDNGKSWSKIDSGMNVSLRLVTATSNGTLVAVGFGCDILRSTDDGKSWSEIDSDENVSIRAVTMASDGILIAVGEEGLILRSSDLGEHWDKVFSGKYWSLSSVTSTPAGTLIALGGNTILRGKDDGSSWWEVVLNKQQWISSVTITPAGSLVAIGGDCFLRSENDGMSWNKVTLDIQGLMSVTTAASGILVAVGDDGRILRSEDDGISWNAVVSGTDTTLNAIAATSAGSLVAVGGGGIILRSKDAGASWDMTSLGEKKWFNSVIAAPDGILVAVGQTGLVMRSTDDGANWDTVNTVTNGNLLSVAASSNGALVAVGDHCRILRSEDKGTSWSRVASEEDGYLYSVMGTADSTFVAVGLGGVIMRSTDNGKTWTNKLAYRKLPAWWLYLLLIFIAAVCTWWARCRAKSSLKPDSLVDKVIKDTPVERISEDRLQMASHASGMANFLRNPATRPPLALGVCGDWGSGKSSLMHLLEKELEQDGVCPVWFNAWHHQQEPSMLAVLLENIRNQAVPTLSRHPILFLVFHGRMLLLRTIANPLATCILFSFLVVGLIFLFSFYEGGSIAACFGECLAAFSQAATKGAWTGKLTGLLSNAKVLGIVLIGLTFLYMWSASLVLPDLFRAFPLSPGKLLATMSGDFKWRAAEGQTAFRLRFARHFETVCKALAPRYMCIFVDDLDRCQPNKAMEVLEAVNYLVSNGNCFVILGLDRKKVEGLVGMAMGELSKEFVEQDSKLMATAVKCDVVDERAIKRKYARNYLEKLISLYIPVQKLDSDATKGLMCDEASSADCKENRLNVLSKAYSLSNKVLPLLVVLLIAACIGYGLYSIPILFDSVKKSYVASMSKQAQLKSSKLENFKLQPLFDKEIKESEYDRNKTDEFHRSLILESRGALFFKDWSLIGIIIICYGMILFYQRMVLKRRIDKVGDSKTYIDALKIWRGLVQSYINTPRGLKRFLNQTRYMAMRNRAYSDQHSFDDKSIAEADIVAVSAMLYVLYCNNNKDIPTVAKNFTSECKKDTNIQGYIKEHKNKFGKSPFDNAGIIDQVLQFQDM